MSSKKKSKKKKEKDSDMDTTATTTTTATTATTSTDTQQDKDKDTKTKPKENVTDEKKEQKPSTGRQSGEDFKKDLAAGKPKFGIFLNSHSHTVAGQFSMCGYDWLLIDSQHGPLDYITQSAMINAISLGKAKSMVRVQGYNDRAGIQQALDMGADGVLIPYVNTKAEVEQAVSCCYYPTKGTRSVYFPQASMNADGLLGYAGNFHKHIIVAIQVETHSCIKNIDDIMTVKGVDIAFLGQNDLCMSMGLYEQYKFPEMYSSPELKKATADMMKAVKKNNKIAGVFLFGTDRVREFLDQGFTFVSIGNDLHHMLTQTTQHIKSLQQTTNPQWNPQSSALL